MAFVSIPQDVLLSDDGTAGKSADGAPHSLDGPGKTPSSDISGLPQLLDKMLSRSNPDRYYHRRGHANDMAPDFHTNSTSIEANILHVGETWTRQRQHSLVMGGGTGGVAHQLVLAAEQKTEYANVMDLLDMLTKSGAQALDDPTQVSLHVVVSSTCRFEDSLIHSVIRGNVNPIQELDSALGMIASTIHNTSIADILRD
jgi:hypothetical protein